MNITKQIARNFVLPALVGMKLEKLLINKSQKKCCIINFHGVRKSNSDVFNNRHIPLKEFEYIIKYLSQNFNVIPLAEAFEIHNGKNAVSHKKMVALTFDDGYLNNFETALPILKKYSVPATFYIVTKGLIDDAFFIWPDLIDILKKQVQGDLTLNGVIFSKPNYYNAELKVDILDYIKKQGAEAETITKQLISRQNNMQQIIDQVPELIQIIREKTFAKYKTESLIEFGSHTHSHFCLEYLDKNAIQHELSESKRLLEQHTERKVISLAFPDGSYTQETIDLAKEIGYNNLVAVDYKLNEQNKNPTILSRFTISNSTTSHSNILRLAKDFDKYGF